LKKVLILSYFFPPCNLTASQRVQSWANYLHTFGYKPIIITRRWDEKIAHLSDVSKTTPPEVKHEIHENYEVFYLPYKSNLRDKIYVRFKETRFNNLRKTLTFFELVLQPFFNFVIPYRNIEKFALQYVRQNPDIKTMVVSGNPFNLYKFGYQLNKETGIKWIADYRDAWTTSTINFINKRLLHKFINKLEIFCERKWVSSASLITASSQPIADHVAALVNKTGVALYNGYVEEDFKPITVAEKFQPFTITYVGTLYDGQKVEVFCAAFKKLIDNYPAAKTKIIFPGLNFYSAQQLRIEKEMKGYENYYECTARMERHKILAIEKQSHLLLHVAWDEHSGIIASKIYEYIASGTFILVTPTDNGAIEEIITKSNCGICTKSVNDTFDFLKIEYEKYLKGIYRVNDTTSENVLQFSRKKQAGKLAEQLDKL
jgi:glycosyltransferase involved in cell wall biosynthesis